MSQLTTTWVDDARALTPGCAHRVHFNNAGASLLPEPVLATVASYTALERDIGGYEAQEECAEQLSGVYTSLASLVGCSAHEIAITDSASRAWQLVFQSIPLCPGDRILTSRSEYGANFLTMLRQADVSGAVVELVPDDEWGQISVDALADMMDDRVKAVCLTHVPTNSALVNPAAGVGAVVRQWPAYYVLDGAQSVGQLPIRVDELGCDVFTTAGRKYLRGPRGTGFLYASDRIVSDLRPMLVDLQAAEWTDDRNYEFWSDARRFETWEYSGAARLGLGAAAEYAMTFDADQQWARVQMLGERLRAGLTEIPGIEVHDLGQVKTGTATFTHSASSVDEICRHLRANSINTYPVSWQYARLDMAPRHLTDVVRASAHYYNTEDEVDLLIDQVRQVSV